MIIKRIYLEDAYRIANFEQVNSGEIMLVYGLYKEEFHFAVKQTRYTSYLNELPVETTIQLIVGRRFGGDTFCVDQHRAFLLTAVAARHGHSIIWK